MSRVVKCPKCGFRHGIWYQMISELLAEWFFEGWVLRNEPHTDFKKNVVTIKFDKIVRWNKTTPESHLIYGHPFDIEFHRDTPVYAHAVWDARLTDFYSDEFWQDIPTDLINLLNLAELESD